MFPLFGDQAIEDFPPPIFQFETQKSATENLSDVSRAAFYSVKKGL
jgi:hypothetical protein